MIEQAVVSSVDHSKGMARVDIEPGGGCCSCSARAVCRGDNASGGRLTVLNPVQAGPGDIVLMDVPNDDYSLQATRLFGGLLGGSLAGLALGLLASALFGLTPTGAGLGGFFLGLAVGAAAVYRRFRSVRLSPPLPVIIDVVRKGGANGSP